MAGGVYRFEIDRSVSPADAESSLHLALFIGEALHGQARVRLDAGYHIDEARNVITVDATTEVGATLVQVFTGLLLREFGEDGFRVRAIEERRPQADVDCQGAENSRDALRRAQPGPVASAHG